MSIVYRSRDGDVVSGICWEHYGQVVGAVEAVYEANPRLADLGPILDAGVSITLPDLPPQVEQTIVRLWT